MIVRPHKLESLDMWIRTMNPALFQLSESFQSSGPSDTDDVKLLHRSLNFETPEENGHESDEESPDEDDSHPYSGDGSKRPRLRLAHACDRCRKRKIRCDTQQPCGPCEAAKGQCTFESRKRKVSSKPKSSVAGEGTRRCSTSGVKRPHSPLRYGNESRDGQTNLEARLAALEAMLGDVPPKVHNAFLSSLDARLGTGTGVGIKEGKGEGVGVAIEALLGPNALNGVGQFADGSSSSWTHPTSGLNSYGADRAQSTLTSDWSALGAIDVGWRGKKNVTKRKEEEGANEMAKRMEGMSFFYEDEIGQAKWQGSSTSR